MPLFINQPLPQAQGRRPLDFSGFGKLIDQYKAKQEIERKNQMAADLLKDYQQNPSNAIQQAYRSGNRNLGGSLMQQQAGRERFNQQQGAIDRRHADSMALQQEKMGLDKEMHRLNIEMQKARLKAMQQPDAMRELKLQKMQLEVDGMKNPANNLNGFKDKKQKLGAQGEFRKEFTKVAGDYIKVRDAQARIEASAQDPSAAGDLALIFNYMKVLDPGSTVREGEFATAQNSAGIPDVVKAKWNALLSGERLGPEQRSDFLNRARLLFGRQEQQYQKTRSTYEGIAKRNGLDVESVLPDWGMAEPANNQLSGKANNPRKRAQDANGNVIELNPETNQWEPVR